MSADAPGWVVEACIAPDHPSLPGHFPGQPVVPGVVLLDAVVAAVQAREPGFRLRGLPTVKFLSPLLPGEVFSMRVQRAESDYRFECRSGDRLLAKGSLGARREAAS